MEKRYSSILGAIGVLFGSITFFNSTSVFIFVLGAIVCGVVAWVAGYGIDSMRKAERSHAIIAFVFVMLMLSFVFTVYVFGNASTVCWRFSLFENRFTGECRSGCAMPWYWMSSERCTQEAREEARMLCGVEEGEEDTACVEGMMPYVFSDNPSFEQLLSLMRQKG